MKLLGKIALLALAVDVFVNYPDVNEVFAREDGNIFFSENYADLDRGKMKVYPVQREEVAEQIEAKKAELAAKVEVVDETIVAPATDAPATDAPATDAPATDAPVKEIGNKKAAPVKKTPSTKTTGKDGKNPENRTQKPIK